MTSEDNAIAALAKEFNVSPETLRHLLGTIRDQISASHFYIYWSARGGGQGNATSRQRLLLAFPSADYALSFAQRNRLYINERPRLRHLSLLQLIQAMLYQPAIVALLFVTEEEELPAYGRLPNGVRIERVDLLQVLQREVGD